MQFAVFAGLFFFLVIWFSEIQFGIFVHKIVIAFLFLSVYNMFIL